MLKGSIVALITPFNDDKSINFIKLRDLIETHCFAQTDALLILGTTSESSSLSLIEKEQIVEFVVRRNAKRMKIVVGLITNNTLEGIEHAKKYESMGADYLLVSPPFYNKTNSTGLIKHFSFIAASVKIPIIVYNVPSRTGMEISIEDFIEIKKNPNITGVKESSKDINHIIDLFQISDDNFHIYCGNDELCYVFLSLGAKGIINVYGNLEPRVIKNLINIFDNNELLGRKYFFNYYELFKVLSIEVNPIPIKELMNYVGLNVGLGRLPLDKMAEKNKKILIEKYIKTKNIRKTY